ncbi:hypothetical protein WMF28_06645 [Sorangium sp. So ce590]
MSPRAGSPPATGASLPQDLEAKLRARDEKATKLAEALVAEVLG